MKKNYIIVIDAGSSKIKTAVYDGDGHYVVSSVRRSPREAASPGLSDAQLYYDVVLQCLKDTADSIGDDRESVDAIVFTGQMAGAVGVDKDWNAVTLWSGTMHAEHIPYFQKMPSEYHDNLLTICGTNAPFMLPKIKWMQDTCETSKQAEKYLIIGNFVAGKMAEIDIGDAFIDRTLLEWTGMADLASDKWSPYLCGLAEMEIGKLPRIVTSSTVIGTLGRQAAQVCGLKAGIPLVAGAGDKPAGCIGAGVVRPGQMIDESSTVGALSQCIDTFVPDIKNHMLETIPSPIPGEYYSSVYFSGSGATVEWFITQLCGFEANEATYNRMNEQASLLPPGSDGLLAIGMLGGRSLPLDPDIRGLWMGHSWNHKTAHFYRALLESFGYEYACVMRVMRETYPHLDTDQIISIGGGANSGLFNQIKSDILGKTYTSLGREDVTILGAAIIGGHAVGIFDDIKQTAERFARAQTRIQPDMKNHEAYQKIAHLYMTSYDTLRPIYEELGRLRKGK